MIAIDSLKSVIQNNRVIFLSNSGGVQMRKKVCIIHTGGTIGMLRTPLGYAPKEGHMAAVLENIPELSSPEMPEVELIEMTPRRMEQDWSMYF